MKNAGLALLIIALSGRCASIAHGRYQHVSVKSTPSEAAIRVDCGDAAPDGGVTPADVILRRGAERCAITLSKAGYEDRRVVFTRALSAVGWANVGPGLVVGIVAGVGATPIFSDTASDNRRANNVAMGGIAVGTGAGLLIDRATGALYRQTPSNVEVTLVPSESP